MITDGILLVDKEKGWTSSDVVVKVRHLFKVKKVGHLGTLDPLASGLLAVTIGKATKLFESFLTKTKEYVATMQFGYETSTLDLEGEVEDRKPAENITIEKINQVLPLFIGEIDQMPPKYSAKKVNGKKAYELARIGEEVKLTAKKVKIDNIEVMDFNSEEKILKFKVVCGGGTYIRSLVRDIAYKLGTVATMTDLNRTKLGDYDLKDSITTKDLKEKSIEELEKYIINI